MCTLFLLNSRADGVLLLPWPTCLGTHSSHLLKLHQIITSCAPRRFTVHVRPCPRDIGVGLQRLLAPSPTVIRRTCTRMDPLSLTASIIAVIGAASAIAKVASKAKLLLASPTEVAALLNEISDFHNFFCGIRDIVAGNLDAALPTHDLNDLCRGSKTTLDELQSLLEQIYNAPSSKLTRFRWIRHRSRIEWLRVDLKDKRTALSASLATVTG